MTSGRHEPIRTCVGCGLREPRGALVRLQADARGRLAVVEERSSMSGRSAYVHRRRDCVERLRKSRLLARSLRRQVEHAEREGAVSRLCGTLREEASAERVRPGN